MQTGQAALRVFKAISMAAAVFQGFTVLEIFFVCTTEFRDVFPSYVLQNQTFPIYKWMTHLSG